MSEEPVQPAQPRQTAPGETLPYLAPNDAAALVPRNRPTYRIARQIYLRSLGVIYLVAFLSLWVQIDGLIGSKGLLPVGDYLDAVRRIGPHPYAHSPTLVW